MNAHVCLGVGEFLLDVYLNGGHVFICFFFLIVESLLKYLFTLLTV